VTGELSMDAKTGGVPKSFHLSETLSREMFKGVVRVEVTYPDGKKKVFVVHNRIVLQGLDFYVRNLAGVNQVSLNYIVFSDSTQPVNDNETTVPGTWKYGVTATKSQPSPRTVRFVANLDGGASGVAGNTLALIALATGADGSGEFSRVLLPTQIPLANRVNVSVTYDIFITPT